MSTIQVKNTVIGTLSAAGGAAAAMLGGWDVLLRALLGFMVLDYLTGWLVAALWHRSGKSPSGALSSAAGFRGIVKKCGVLGLVWMAATMDAVTGSEFVRDAVCLFFIANEGLSVLENTAVMGVPYPAFVKNMLDALKQKAEGGKEDD